MCRCTMESWLKQDGKLRSSLMQLQLLLLLLQLYE
ncbi:hypothetical protein LINPERHAP1_LOCUS21874 [Linum perenne]